MLYPIYAMYLLDWIYMIGYIIYININTYIYYVFIYMIYPYIPIYKHIVYIGEKIKVFIFFWIPQNFQQEHPLFNIQKNRTGIKEKAQWIKEKAQCVEWVCREDARVQQKQTKQAWPQLLQPPADFQNPLSLPQPKAPKQHVSRQWEGNEFI